jgi:TolB protein
MLKKFRLSRIVALLLWITLASLLIGCNSSQRTFQAPGLTPSWTLAPMPTFPPTWTPTPIPTVMLRKTPTPLPSPTSTAQSTPSLRPTPAHENLPQSQVAYVRTLSRPGGEYDLYLLNTDGSNSYQLTSLPGLETSPAWSPDGQLIAFVATQDSLHPNDCAAAYPELRCNFDIYTIRIDGSDLKRLTTSPTYDRGPAWSPDGKHIAFSSRKAGARFGYIYVMTRQGTNLTALTSGSNRDTAPAWSPDGRSIVFTRETCICDNGSDKSKYDLYVMAANGHNVRRLTNNDFDNVNPAWSPDGQSIAWIRADPNSQDAPNTLALMRPTGTNLVILQPTVSIAPGYPPTWSPDSQQLIFVSDAGPGLNIYRINRDGTGLTQLTDGTAYFSAPAWSPILTRH